MPDNATGTMIPGTIIVTYEYKAIEAKVIEKHINVVTNELMEKETTHNGYVGDKYKISSKEFKGYDLVTTKLPTNAEGTMTKEPI